MKTNSKGFAPILVILVVLILLGGVYYLGTLKSKPNLISNTTTSTPTSTVKPTTDLTANWKTYTSTKLPQLSFSALTLKYPSGWILKDDNDALGTRNLDLSKDGYTISIYQAAYGGAVCLFSDSPDFQGPSGDYRSVKFTEIKSSFGTLRYFINPNQLNNYTFCQMDGEYFGNPTGVGSLTIVFPEKGNNSVFKEAIEIIKSITLIQ